MRYQDVQAGRCFLWPKVLAWFDEDNPYRIFVMTTIGSKNLEKLLGKRTQTYVGGDGRFNVWHVHHEGADFFIFDKNEIGTSIEAAHGTTEDQAVSFHKWLFARAEAEGMIDPAIREIAEGR